MRASLTVPQLLADILSRSPGTVASKYSTCPDVGGFKARTLASLSGPAAFTFPATFAFRFVRVVAT